LTSKNVFTKKDFKLTGELTFTTEDFNLWEFNSYRILVKQNDKVIFEGKVNSTGCM